MQELVGRLLVGGIHLLIISTLAAITLLTLKLINSAPSPVERNLRYLALAAGLLLFFAANTLNIDLASLTFGALSLAFPGRTAIADFLLPASAGICSSWFLLKGLKEKARASKAIKLVILLTAFLLFAFAGLYAESVKAGEGKARLLLPNVSFVLALILYAVFRYDPEENPGTKDPEGDPGLGDWWRRV